MSDDRILSIIASELSMANNNLPDFEQPLSYYLGRPNGKETDGGSTVVSTDVADAIEWIMPQIMKSFTQNNEIVIFDPVHEGDERQAELESEYVYEVLMKQNDGFIILHQFVKDALLQRNGILKAYYAKEFFVKIGNYTGITEEQLQVLLAAEGVELVEKSEYVDEAQTTQKVQLIQQQLQQVGPQLSAQQRQALLSEMNRPVFLYDVKVSVTRERGKIYVDPVAPEDFRVNANHNSINLSNARFTAHMMQKTVSELIKYYGVTKAQADTFPDSSTDYDKEYRFSLQNETITESDSADESQALKDVAECFMEIDVDNTGISKKMKITVITDGDVPTDIIGMDEIEDYPWVSTTAFLMSHKFMGLSIFDRLKQLQDQKTAIWRNILDNMYLQNNQRTAVVENQVNIDDLLISRPGGIVRVKRLDAIMPIATPPLGQESYNMLEYLDRVRAGRTGVDPDGNATPTSIGDRVGSQGVDRLLNAKEELVGLIVRVIAETGIKPLCVKIRDLAMRHIDAVVDFRFRGVWQKIQPSAWCDRTSSTVRVGTGSGNQAAKIAAITQVLAIQEKILANPSQTLLSPKNVFTAIDDFCKFSGLNGASRYFMDPESPEGQQMAQSVQQMTAMNNQKQEEIQQVMLKSELAISQAEVTKANSQLESIKYKAMAEDAKLKLDRINFIHSAELDSLKQQLEEAKAVAERYGKDAELKFKYDNMNTLAAIELTRIEAEKQAQENENYMANKATVNS